MLSILGTVFLIIISLVAALGIWLFVKYKSAMSLQTRVSAIEEGMQLPEYVLEPKDNPTFVHPEAIAALIRQAKELGATSCGNYDVPAAEMRMCAFVLATPPAYIAIYDHAQLEPWTDIVLRLDQDRSFTASTVPEVGRGAPRHPDDEMTFFAPGSETGVLVKAVAECANRESTLPAAPEEFKEYFEAFAEKSRQYMQTQTVSQEWLNSIAEGTGVELSGDEAAQINIVREGDLVEQTEKGCFESLAKSGEFTAAEWDEIRDSLVAVWDEMPNDYVMGAIYNADIPEELESDVDALENSHGPARERIAEINAKLPEENRLILVGRVSSPVEADIYRAS